MFVQKILQMNMLRPNTEEHLTQLDVETQIAYCRDLPFPYILEEQQGLKTTERVNREREFLEMIKPGATSLSPKMKRKTAMP